MTNKAVTDIATALADAKTKIDALDAEALLAHVLDKDRSYFRAWPEQTLEQAQLSQFQQLVVRRTQGEPLAYLTGWREFWSLLLQVSPATLIPRPDTETLVEQALNIIPQDANWHIADLGTGSGAIALAIASERPGCSLVATDTCPDALAVAQTNAQRLKLHNVEFRQGSWHQAFKLGEQFQLIASNPPYIDADDVHLTLNGLPHEPQQALTPGKDGMAAIRTIAEKIRIYLCPHGWLLLEHGYDQGQAVRQTLHQQMYSDILTHHDLGNNERVTQGKRPN